MNVSLRVKLVIAAVVLGPWFAGNLARAVCPMTKVNKSACPHPATTLRCVDAGNEMDCVSRKESIKENNFFSCQASNAEEQCLDAMGTIWCYTEYECFWDFDDCKIDPDTGQKHFANYKYTELCP